MFFRIDIEHSKHDDIGQFRRNLTSKQVFHFRVLTVPSRLEMYHGEPVRTDKVLE
jgi:hypothetical protein